MNKLIVANFKMNATEKELKNLINLYKNNVKTNLALCLPYPYLSLFNQINKNNLISLGAQNVSQFEKGSYTGEVSALMLSDFNVKYCLVGHAERRKFNAENTLQCHEKIKQLLKNNIVPILCIGENLNQYNQNLTLKIIRKQINGALKKLNKEDIKKVIIAYEPIWCIENATELSPEQANDIASEIIKAVQKLTQSNHHVCVLYGGNVLKDNANLFLQEQNIGGILVGKESLNAENFVLLLNNLK